MKNIIVLILFALVPLVSMSGNSLFDETNSRYNSTIYPVGAQSIFENQEQIDARQLSYGLPVNPGEPEPDPEQTPIGDIPFILMGILGTTYIIKKKEE